MRDVEFTSIRPDPYSIEWTLRPIHQGGAPMTATMTRREQAEASADLFEVPLADLYRRYGAVLLPPATRSALLRTQKPVEVGSGE